MGKSPNEMGNCPFASPLVTPLAPGTRRFFHQEKSLKTRRLPAKSGGLADLSKTAETNQKFAACQIPIPTSGKAPRLYQWQLRLVNSNKWLTQPT